MMNYISASDPGQSRHSALIVWLDLKCWIVKHFKCHSTSRLGLRALWHRSSSTSLPTSSTQCRTLRTAATPSRPTSNLWLSNQLLPNALPNEKKHKSAAGQSSYFPWSIIVLYSFRFLKIRKKHCVFVVRIIQLFSCFLWVTCVQTQAWANCVLVWRTNIKMVCGVDTPNQKTSRY